MYYKISFLICSICCLNACFATDKNSILNYFNPSDKMSDFRTCLQINPTCTGRKDSSLNVDKQYDDGWTRSGNYIPKDKFFSYHGTEKKPGTHITKQQSTLEQKQTLENNRNSKTKNTSIIAGYFNLSNCSNNMEGKNYKLKPKPNNNVRNSNTVTINNIDNINSIDNINFVKNNIYINNITIINNTPAKNEKSSVETNTISHEQDKQVDNLENTIEKYDEAYIEDYMGDYNEELSEFAPNGENIFQRYFSHIKYRYKRRKYRYKGVTNPKRGHIDKQDYRPLNMGLYDTQTENTTNYLYVVLSFFYSKYEKKSPLIGFANIIKDEESKELALTDDKNIELITNRFNSTLKEFALWLGKKAKFCVSYQEILSNNVRDILTTQNMNSELQKIETILTTAKFKYKCDYTTNYNQEDLNSTKDNSKIVYEYNDEEFEMAKQPDTNSPWYNKNRYSNNYLKNNNSSFNDYDNCTQYNSLYKRNKYNNNYRNNYNWKNSNDKSKYNYEPNKWGKKYKKCKK